MLSASGSCTMAALMPWMSSRLLFGLALFCVDEFRPRLIRDALRVARAVTVTGAVNQAVKFLAPRERPFF